MQDAVIVSAVRTAVGKAPAGTLRATRPDEMAGVVLREALARVPTLDASEVDDVIMGCAMPEAEQGLNVARIASLRAGVPVTASAVTVNRFCSSGLQAIAYGAERIMCGFARCRAGGRHRIHEPGPHGGPQGVAQPGLVNSYPDVYLSTGLVAENHARESSISREAQDAWALRSHQRSLAAIDEGRFDDRDRAGHRAPRDPRSGNGGAPAVREQSFAIDEGPRRDTSAEALARLRPAFHIAGTVTAGNASQMSDGAAAVLLVSAGRARELNLTPLARFVAFATAGVEPERFGIGPVPAVRKVLKLAGLSLDDIELIELNEAFASQVLACLRELDVDPERVNVNGGAIALGHPLGCTGAKLTTTILYEMQRRRARYGLVTMCVGGGMGAAGIFERL